MLRAQVKTELRSIRRGLSFGLSCIRLLASVSVRLVASQNGDVRISLNLGLRIWKAGWVHALAGSNPASSAVRILRCVSPTAKRPLLLNYPQWPSLTHLRFP
jgi:hypothetical protein